MTETSGFAVQFDRTAYERDAHKEQAKADMYPRPTLPMSLMEVAS